MKIKKALKEKNRLVKEIGEQIEIAKTYNSIETGNPRRFSAKAAIENAHSLTKELVELKAKIHRANQPVYEKIFMASELKSLVKNLKALPVEEGKITPTGYGAQIASNREVELTATEKVLEIKRIESLIDTIQEELDTHNATTDI